VGRNAQWGKFLKADKAMEALAAQEKSSSCEAAGKTLEGKHAALTQFFQPTQLFKNTTFATVKCYKKEGYRVK